MSDETHGKVDEPADARVDARFDAPAARQQRRVRRARPCPVGPQGFERRRAYVAPLFAYLKAHGIVALWAARRSSLKATGVMMTRLTLSRIKCGTAVAPDWFIEGMCGEIGQPVEAVMGADWAERHLSLRAPDAPGVPVDLPVARRTA